MGKVATWLLLLWVLGVVEPGASADVTSVRPYPQYLNFDTTEDAIEYYEKMLHTRPVRPPRPTKHWTDNVDEKGNPISPSPEHALYRSLLGRHYLKHVRPVKNHLHPVVVKVGMCVMMIEDLIERDQIMVMAACVKMSWKDEFLTWNPDIYDNVTWMAISSDKIWLPDIAIVNSPEPLKMTRKTTNLDLNYLGEVGYFPSGRLSTRCNLVITYFPFDWQHCEVRFESWIYPTKYLEIELYPGEEAVDLKEYYVNFQWTIKGYTIKPELVDYDGKNFSSITFVYSLRRKPAFYFMYFIFPELLLALLQTLSHTLPVEHPGRMTMLTALFIGTTVTHSGIAAHIPKSSDTMSLLQVYMSIMSINLVIALIVTFAMLYTVLRYPNAEPSFVAMTIALFSIVWPSKPESGKCRRRQRQDGRVTNNKVGIPAKARGSEATYKPPVKLKKPRRSANKLPENLSDLFLHHSSSTTSPQVWEGPVATMAATPCCDDTKDFPKKNNFPSAERMFAQRSLGSKSSGFNFHPRENYIIMRDPAFANFGVDCDGEVAAEPLSPSSTSSSSSSQENGVYNAQYMSAQRCLYPETSPETPQVPSGIVIPRIVYEKAPPKPSVRARRSNSNTQSQHSELAKQAQRQGKCNGGVETRTSRPTSLVVKTSGNDNAIVVVPQKHESSWTDGNLEQHGMEDFGLHHHHHHYGGGHDEHDLKRRWLMYCVALDKSIMYANLIWNVTIPFALFFVVPYLHETTMLLEG